MEPHTTQNTTLGVLLDGKSAENGFVGPVLKGIVVRSFIGDKNLR